MTNFPPSPYTNALRTAKAIPIMTGTVAAESVLGLAAKYHARSEFVLTSCAIIYYDFVN